MTPVPLPKTYAPTHGVVVPRHDAQALIAYLAGAETAPLPWRRGRHRSRRQAWRARRPRANPPAVPAAAPLPAVTMRPRARRCSPPRARLPSGQRRGSARSLPLAQGRRRRSTRPTRRSISRSCCTDCRAPTSAASSTPVQCRRSAPRSAMPKSPISSITSAVPGATTAQPVIAEQVAAERAKHNDRTIEGKTESPCITI